MNRLDDPNLTGELVLYRRIPWNGGHVQWDVSGIPKPSSQNFSDKDQELSMYIAVETTIDKVLSGHDGFGLVQLTIQDFRNVYRKKSNPLVICRDDKEPQNGHILICGKPTPSMKKELRDLAQWVPGRLPKRDPEA